MNDKRRKIILIALVAFLVLLLLAVFFLPSKPKKNPIAEAPEDKMPIEFLSEEKKLEYGLSPETKAQVFYDAEGNEIYKIIRDDSELVDNPIEAGLKMSN